MEELKNNRIFNILFWIFISISLLHIAYAVMVFRGMYCDSAFFMITLLNDFSDGVHRIYYDPTHTRVSVLALQELPVIITDFLFHIKNKYVLMGIYTFSQIAFPFLALLWNYKLSKRTGRIDIFFWSVFSYGAIVCLYMIFCMVESLIGVILHFVLWNYLVANIEYKKRDFLFVIFLLIMLSGTFEYVIYFGFVYFIAHFFYLERLKGASLKSQLMKCLIGWGAGAISLFHIIYMFKVPGEDGEIMRFFKECYDYIPYALNLNSLLSIITVILLFLLIFKKKYIGYILTGILISLYIIAFIHLIKNPQFSVIPMWEGHMRSIPCWAMPLIFVIMYVQDIFGKINNVKFANYLCVALICCIFQTCWQMVDSYYWDKNIQYIKMELAKSDDLLYIPSEHKAVISDFGEENLRRYIWHGVFAATSILFSDTYEQKTLLVNYDVQQNEGNGNYRNLLYVDSTQPNTMSIPFGSKIKIKNKYWDLTKCAEALDKYNKEHNIEVDNYKPMSTIEKNN